MACRGTTSYCASERKPPMPALLLSNYRRRAADRATAGVLSTDPWAGPKTTMGQPADTSYLSTGATFLKNPPRAGSLSITSNPVYSVDPKEWSRSPPLPGVMATPPRSTPPPPPQHSPSLQSGRGGEPDVDPFFRKLGPAPGLFTTNERRSTGLAGNMQVPPPGTWSSDASRPQGPPPRSDRSLAMVGSSTMQTNDAYKMKLGSTPARAPGTFITDGPSTSNLAPPAVRAPPGLSLSDLNDDFPVLLGRTSQPVGIPLRSSIESRRE
mmetsp:Transcript_149/g.338  ORF Transcript_149/g.338 Transcript_149/m.338 type:complete len:267 (+) Transcript_149:477-1277(+)